MRHHTSSAEALQIIDALGCGDQLVVDPEVRDDLPRGGLIEDDGEGDL